MRERVKKLYQDFKNATANLNTAVHTAKDELKIDGTIKRFELCFELSWKLIKAYLEDKGIICNSPRECFKHAKLNALIEDEEIWMAMIEDRNFLVHTYTFEESRKIFENIKEKYLNSFSRLNEFLREDFADELGSKA